jgi:hypothetical protein
MTLDEHVDAIIAQVGADRQVTPDEIRAVQRLLSAIGSIAQMNQAKAAAGQQGEPVNDDAEPFGASSGTEDAQPEVNEDASYVQG